MIHLQFTMMRQQYLLQELRKTYTRQVAKRDFVGAIVDGSLKLLNASASYIKQWLEEHNYPLDDSAKTYDYLLTMKIHSLTKEKVRLWLR